MKVIATANTTDRRGPTRTLFEVAHVGGLRDWLVPSYLEKSEFRQPSAALTGHLPPGYPEVRLPNK